MNPQPPVTITDVFESTPMLGLDLAEARPALAAVAATTRAAQAPIELAAARAHPSDAPGGIADDHGVRAATSFATTAPAPTKACAPIVTPHTMLAFAPSVAPRSTRVGTNMARRLLERGARIRVVREDDVRAHEDVVLDAHAVPDQDGVLDRHAIADPGSRSR